MGEKKHSINLVFTIALLGVFALSALFVAVLGAQVYGRTAEQMDENYNTRTSLVYITEKIRQCPGKNIKTENVGDETALVLSQDIEGETYESWIFQSEGKLKEALVSKGQDVKPSDGQEIMEINKFFLSKNDNLLEISVMDEDDNKDSVTISVKD